MNKILNKKGRGGTFFKQELGRGVKFLPHNFLGGFSFETLHYFENHCPPWDVINDRSLMVEFADADSSGLS